ncbi:3TM-type holin [Chachezhania antarctica]|uniref:3TM-type holin n=1 Tax=Chachezhania antarctica TaxID=2340860 RepID=UPI000EB496DC|nr:3TM-type holin [Chachezhania antarctica]|tara:strand:- start:6579 stop:7106 length:528 start_codon:yes stop_codon:yes gene_type:complete
MVSSALVTLAAQAGAPLVERILANRIGQGNASLVGEVLQRVAQNAGTTPDQLPALAETRPEDLGKAMAQAEAEAPELIELHETALKGQFALLQAEKSDPVWMRAWRPLSMYLVGFLWLWSIVALHVLNAIFKIALPQPDLATLFQLTAVWLGLYMGGHTVKDIAFQKWGGKGVPR